MSAARLEKGAYKGVSVDEIKSDLRQQGYNPLLIEEDPDDSLDPHQHAESHILVQVGGDMVITTGGKDVHMVPGDKLTIPPDVEHASKFGSDGSKYLWVEF
jgi:quercetin dioxygenase-like cupin family protein